MLAVRDVVPTAHGANVLNKADQPANKAKSEVRSRAFFKTRPRLYSIGLRNV